MWRRAAAVVAAATAGIAGVACASERAPSPAAAPSALPSRSELLARSQRSEQVDVLVIGGGATGCGVALDSVTRGLSTVLVEQASHGNKHIQRAQTFASEEKRPGFIFIKNGFAPRTTLGPERAVAAPSSFTVCQQDAASLFFACMPQF
jgi:hypothetical protein